MKQSEIIDAMLDKIPDENHWCKGSFSQWDNESHKSYCMLGAYMALPRASGYNVLSPLVDKIRETYPSLDYATEADVGHDIALFNDMDSTTYEDVRAILEKTRAALQEVGK